MSSTLSEKQREATNPPLRFVTLGCVKWFNNRSGYGFIVAIGDQAHYGDVFVHHSQLRISDSHIYKTLIPGEYVQFEIIPTSDGKHKYQANNVTGVYGGKLMCESSVDNRRTPRPSPTSRQSVEDVAPQPTYKILQRSSSSSPTTDTPTDAVTVPTQPIPTQGHENASTPPATGVALPKSKRPRNPTTSPALPASSPRVGPSKRTAPKKG